MHICNALALYNYSEFSLTIIKYIDVTDISLKEARKLIILFEQYYIDLLLPEPQGARSPLF
jgi:hypothetical protein